VQRHDDVKTSHPEKALKWYPNLGDEIPLLRERLSETQLEELRQFIRGRDRSKREACRAQAIILLDQDISGEIIESSTGFKRRQPFRLRQTYLTKGLDSLRDTKKGEPKRLLTKNQLQEVVYLVRNKKPSELDPYFRKEEFWSTSILGSFIERHYGIKYKSKTSYYLLFKEARFTFHKPGRVYEKHSDQEVELWKVENESKIFQALEEPNTVVLCEDEMLLSTQTTFQKIWLPEGEFPRVEISNTKKNRSLYGFLNLKTGTEHAFKTDWQNMYITVGVLEKIRKIYPTQKLFIIWDGAGWHRGSVTQEFIKKDHNIQTLYFPRYAPELNPQEHVWKQGRAQCSHNQFIANIDIATDEFVGYLNSQKFHYKLLGFSALS